MTEIHRTPVTPTPNLTRQFYSQLRSSSRTIRLKPRMSIMTNKDVMLVILCIRKETTNPRMSEMPDSMKPSWLYMIISSIQIQNSSVSSQHVRVKLKHTGITKVVFSIHHIHLYVSSVIRPACRECSFAHSSLVPTASTHQLRRVSNY